MISNGRARLVILISGRGSNMVSIIEAIDANQLDADIVAVISNRQIGRASCRERV